MSQTNSDQCPSPTPAPFNQDFWDFQANALQVALVTASLPAALYGTYEAVPFHSHMILQCLIQVYSPCYALRRSMPSPSTFETLLSALARSVGLMVPLDVMAVEKFGFQPSFSPLPSSRYSPRRQCTWYTRSCPCRAQFSAIFCTRQMRYGDFLRIQPWSFRGRTLSRTIPKLKSVRVRWH